MLKVEDIPVAVATGGMYRHDADVPARFAVGHSVVVKNHQPRGHTRLPGYLRGKPGIVFTDNGVFIFPDTLAHGGGEKPQHCYTVHFEAQDVWGPKGVKGDTLRVDMFDDYLDVR